MEVVRTHPAVTAAEQSNSVVVVGGSNIQDGESLRTAKRYNVNSNKWSDLPEFPYKIFMASAVAQNRKVYVMAGKNQETGKTVGDLHVLDLSLKPDARSWEKLESMKQRRRGCAAVRVEDFIYVFGGYNAKDGGGEEYLDSVERYDIANNKWHSIESMSVARAYAAATTDGENVYVIGGQCDSSLVVSRSQSGEIFNVKTREWRQLFTPMMSRRYMCEAVTLSHYVVVIGGKNEEEKALSTAEALDTNTGKWETIKTGNKRYGFGVAVVKKRTIVVVGGAVRSKAVAVEIVDDHFNKFMPPRLTGEARSKKLFGDNDVGPDRLGIEAHAHALADTIAFQDLKPPFVVGLLGGWGSGKSFTFNLMMNRWKEIQKLDLTIPQDSKRFPFVGHLYVIKFDAWTFAKGNLWSSLMYHILVGINDQLHFESLLRKQKGGEKIFLKGVSVLQLIEDLSTEEQNYLKQLVADEGLRNEFVSRNGNITEALAKAANVEYKEDEKKLEKKKKLLERKKAMAKNAKAWEVIRQKAGPQLKSLIEESYSAYTKKHTKSRRQVIAYLQGEAKKRDDSWTETIKSLGEQFNQQDDKKKQTQEEDTASRDEEIHSLYEFLEKEGNADMIQSVNDYLEGEFPTIDDVIRDLSVLRKFALMWKSANFTFLGWSVLIGGAIVGVTITVAVFLGTDWIAGFATAAGAVVAWVIATVSYLAKVAKTVTKPFKSAFEEAQQAELDLETGLKAAENKEINVLQGEIDSIQQRVWLREGEPVDKVVRERVEDSDYEKALGVVHQAQEDLNRLSRALANQSSEEIFPRGKARIVLFVDDLDRCPPKKVVEMLEAVQLLVKTKLFVVVVAIDARFVTLSLEKEYSEILRRNGDPSGLDYLEKIIQLPYRVPPINRKDNMISYLEHQMDESPTPSIAESSEEDDDETEASPQEVKEKPDGESAQSLRNDSVAQEASGAPGVHNGPKLTETTLKAHNSLIPIPMTKLKFTKSEVRLLAEACLVVKVSPRSAKRVVNVFKVMKIIWEKRGRKPNSDETDACLVILAMCASKIKVIRLGMCRVFSKLERNIEILYRHGNLATYLIDEIGELGKEAMHKCKDMIKTHLSNTLSWTDFQDDFWLVRSFTFVGEFFEDDDLNQEEFHPPSPPEDSTTLKGANGKFSSYQRMHDEILSSLVRATKFDDDVGSEDIFHDHSKAA